MQRSSLPWKIGLLMFLAILLIASAGYLSYRSLSSIVSSIHQNSGPDDRILDIRDISADLQNAGNSVRLFILTNNQEDIQPYYEIIPRLDSKLSRLRAASRPQKLLVAQIDTIGRLIKENIVVWNQLIALQHNDTVEHTVQRIIGKLSIQPEPAPPERFLKRVFGRKNKNKTVNQDSLRQTEIINDLNQMQEQEDEHNLELRDKESLLASTSDQIRTHFYTLISTFEAEVHADIEKKGVAAERLALKTYRWLAIFSACGTLLVILVLFTIFRYLRKTRQYQKALEDSQEETLLLAKTREMFVANMSHEIRTPVTAISGYAEQLLQNHPDDPNRPTLEIIHSASEHLVKILNDVLDFSKLNHGAIELEKIPFAPGPVMEEVVYLLDKQAALKGNHLRCILNPGIPQALLGDPYRLRQILINLLGNAIKFTDRGEVTLQASAEEAKTGEATLVITVSDTGIGIDKEKQEKIFEEFTQADENTARQYGGTGLGLSIVKRLVELHGGSVSLQSVRGRGTHVTCRLVYPVSSQVPVPSQPVSLSLPKAVRDLHILIVDDEDFIRMLYKTILARWQVTYQEARSGMEAIRILQQSSFDLIIMDLRMPNLDGLNALKMIRTQLNKDPETLPVIGVSAEQNPAETQTFLHEGMNAFMSKPFTEKMLLDTIQSVLHKEKKSGPAMDTDNHMPAGQPETDIDLGPLYRLADQDESYVKQLVIGFMESTEKGLAELREAANSGDANQAAETAHRISSPCRHVGATVLYENLHTLEQQARTGADRSLLLTLTDHSCHEYEKVKQMLHARMEKIVP